MTRHACSAHTAEVDTDAAVAAVIEQLGSIPARSLVFFASPGHDGSRVRAALEARFPRASVVGCSSNGEFTDRGFGGGGLAALALDDALSPWSGAACADLDDGVQRGVERAVERLSQAVGSNLREVDPRAYIGVALLDGACGEEEEINEALGNAVPLVSFVGGSAGDNIQFKETSVHGDGRSSRHGVSLLLLRPAVPFRVLKTCNFVATDRELTITKADPKRRLVHEINGRPAAPFYAELIGAAPSELGFPHFLANPLGLMIDGKPWLRSVVRIEAPHSLFFACGILEGITLRLMQGRDLVQDIATALGELRPALGQEPGAGIFFNCAYRMLEAQIRGSTEAYHRALSGFPLVGCHTNGESYLGHINQTLTGLVLGQP